MELRIRKIAEHNDQTIYASCHYNEEFRWGGKFLPTITQWAKAKYPQLSNNINKCIDALDIPYQNLPADNCNDNFESLIEEYPETIRKNVNLCYESEINKLFTSDPLVNTPYPYVKKIEPYTWHLYWRDESNQ